MRHIDRCRSAKPTLFYSLDWRPHPLMLPNPEFDWQETVSSPNTVPINAEAEPGAVTERKSRKGSAGQRFLGCNAASVEEV